MASFFTEGKLMAIKAVVGDYVVNDPKWHLNQAEEFGLELRNMLVMRQMLMTALPATVDFDWECFKERCNISRVNLYRALVAQHYMLAMHASGKRPLVNSASVFNAECIA